MDKIPKVIPLKELSALCKRAGLRVDEWGTSWDVYHDYENYTELIFSPYVSQKWNPDYRTQRQNLKAFCLGLIILEKQGERCKVSKEAERKARKRMEDT